MASSPLDFEQARRRVRADDGRGRYDERGGGIGCVHGKNSAAARVPAAGRFDTSRARITSYRACSVTPVRHAANGCERLVRMTSPGNEGARVSSKRRPPLPEARGTVLPAASRAGRSTSHTGVSGCPSRNDCERDAIRRWRPNPDEECSNVRHDASNAGSRRPFRPPDPLLESEDGRLHLRPAQQDPHRQPRKDAGDVQRRDEVRASARAQPRHRSCSSAPSARRATSSPRKRSAPACRTSTTAGSAACCRTSRRSRGRSSA